MQSTEHRRRMKSTSHEAEWQEREEWMRLAQDMRMLVRLFGFTLSEERWSDVDDYTRAIDCLDRIVDDVEDAADRLLILNAAVALLEQNEALDDGTQCSVHTQHLVLGGELESKLTSLRSVLRRQNSVAVFCAKLQEAAACSEAIRTVGSRRRYALLTRKEGELASELFVLLLGDDVPLRFREFLVHVGGPANLLDNLRDARRDHDDGILPLRPGIRLHLTLAWMLVRSGFDVVKSSPAPFRIAMWGLSELKRPIAKAAAHRGP